MVAGSYYSLMLGQRSRGRAGRLADMMMSQCGNDIADGQAVLSKAVWTELRRGRQARRKMRRCRQETRQNQESGNKDKRVRHRKKLRIRIIEKPQSTN